MKFLVIAFLSLISQSGEAAESNFASWSASFMQGKFNNNWGWYGEIQTRLNDSSNTVSSLDPFLMRGNRFLIRPALRWLPLENNSLQFHLGYGWTPNLSPWRNENRFWQQVLYQSDGDRWWWTHRLRIEERWIQDSDAMALRARYFARLLLYCSQENKRAVLGHPHS